MSATLTGDLAAFIEAADCGATGLAGADKAKKVIADTFAVILSGAGSEVAPPILAFARKAGLGEVPVMGTPDRLSRPVAALVQGTFGAALDFDDVLSMMPGHPAAVIMPALLSAAQGRAVSGEEFIDAYVIGLEVGSKLSQGVGLKHYFRGFHATGTIAIFCAVAALARMERLSQAQTRQAFGIAASTASGLQANFGSMTKPFHSGWAAQAAVTAVALVQEGFTASEAIFEAPGGYLAAYGTEESDAAKVMPLLGQPWTIVEPGIALKKFPTCYATHRAIDALGQIEARLGRLKGRVRRIVCKVAPKSLRPLPFMRPKTGLESKFSMPHALAAAIHFDTLKIASFTDEAVRIPEILELYEKIEAIEDIACTDGDPDFEKKSSGTRGFVLVEVELEDGTVDSARVDIPPGHPKRELTWDELESKFVDCADSCGIGSDHARATFSRLRQLETVVDISALSESLMIQAKAD
ncbi:MmgE/PrpD family protein [Pelagibacterium lacus]|uniref:MmgE/PrpD family protein n=1 Tax=Pelagibacterium lacus TaxID=2282655 RepID=A0A369W6L3_9HYPH|nr:MmgE/PrpD family protein [Pelagibacterium lacus]RDE09677.1 MmgE/PrpD family protein [Pelagibacterium lacus]